MSDDDSPLPLSDIDILRNVIAGNNQLGSWAWPDKQIKERSAADDILRAAQFHVENLVSLPRDQDPPDCEATIDGILSAVEVTELVHLPTRKRSIKAAKERNAGKEPEKSEAHFDWAPGDLLNAIQKRINTKERKLQAARCDRYDRIILVIFTHEMYLYRDSVSEFIKDAYFRADLITDVVLGLSYHPNADLSSGSYPAFRLSLSKPCGATIRMRIPRQSG